MEGWNPVNYNPLTAAPRSPTMRDMVKPDPQSVSMPLPFLVGDPDPLQSPLDIQTSD